MALPCTREGLRPSTPLKDFALKNPISARFTRRDGVLFFRDLHQLSIRIKNTATGKKMRFHISLQ